MTWEQTYIWIKEYIRRPESKETHGHLAFDMGIILKSILFGNVSLLATKWTTQWGLRFRALAPKFSRLEAKQEWFLFGILSDTYYWKDR